MVMWEKMGKVGRGKYSEQRSHLIAQRKGEPKEEKLLKKASCVGPFVWNQKD